VDAEVQHDEYGLPFLGGRALKGLLGAECAEIVFALEQAGNKQIDRWRTVEKRLFGETGSTLDGEAILQVGPARLPDDLRAAIAKDVNTGSLTRADVLETLTVLRTQTAMDANGAPKKETLRTMRVIIRGLEFFAALGFSEDVSDGKQADELALLAATVKALRRAGTGRNRGVGRIKAELLEANHESITDRQFEHFKKAVTP